MTDAPLEPIAYAVPSSRPKPWQAVVGWVLGGLVALALIAGGVTDVLKLDFVVQEMTKAGYPESAIRPLGVTVIACGLLYFVPQTAVLGGLLLTAYLGGAVCHHVRSGDPVGMAVMPVVFAVPLWLGLLLREPRLRALLPLRRT